jgi:hypothetical protein
MKTNSKFINLTCDNYYENPKNIDNNKLCLFNPILFTLIVNNQKKDLIYALKNNKNNINIQDKDGDTPLHIAVFLCNYEIIKILLNNNANINLKDKYGQTAIHRLYFGIKDDNITPFSLKIGTVLKCNCTLAGLIILDPNYLKLIIFIGLLSFINLKDLLYFNGLSLKFM